MDDEILNALAQRVMQTDTPATTVAVREWLRAEDSHSAMLNSGSLKVRAYKVANIVRKWRETDVCTISILLLIETYIALFSNICRQMYFIHKHIPPTMRHLVATSTNQLSPFVRLLATIGYMIVLVAAVV
jgi:hypothetical protein